jgi:hypothetical protein
VRVLPDDEVYRVNTVWLGPTGLTFPWTARYLAYAVWLVTFLLVLLFERITPLHIGVPPVWEICLTTLFTYAVMGLVDHERPVRAVWETFRADLNAPRQQQRIIRTRTQASVRVHERRPPRRRIRRAQQRAADGVPSRRSGQARRAA